MNQLELPKRATHFTPIAALVLSVLFFPIAGHADYIYVANFFGGNIPRYDTSGNMSVFASGLSGVHGVTVDGSGNVYAADAYDARLMKFSPSGQGTQLALWGTAWDQAIACDNNGNVYCANNGNIIKFDSAGNESTFVSGASYGMSYVNGLTFDNSGNLYATGLGNTGYFLKRFNALGQGTVFSTTVPANPKGLAFDTSGNLYVAGFAYGQIEKYDSAGQATLFASSGLNAPVGMSFDSNGNLYVANHGNGTIERFDPNGNASVFATGLSSPCYLVVQVIPEASSLVFFALGLSAVFLGSRRLR